MRLHMNDMNDLGQNRKLFLKSFSQGDFPKKAHIVHIIHGETKIGEVPEEQGATMWSGKQ